MAIPLALTLFLLVFFTELLGLVGKSRMIDAGYSLFLRISPSPAHQKQRKLKREILTTKAELLSTSSQDQFAKWAKLRRKLDKSVADLDSLNNSLSSHRNTFSWFITVIYFIIATALPFVFTSWHRKTPIFYVPEGWFGPSEWFLRLPFAPAGAVSCAAWTMIVRKAIRSMGRVSWDIFEGFTSAPPQPVKEPSATPDGQTSEKIQSDKEL